MKPAHESENASIPVHDRKRVVADLITSARDACADKTAAFQGSSTITYGELCEGSERLGRFLRDLGVEKGDRVCFYLEKMFEKIMSIFGISMAGGVFVPINRLSKPGQAVHILNDSGARILITTASRLTSLTDVIHEVNSLQTVISIGPVRDIEAPPGISVIEWGEIMDRPGGSVPGVHVSEHDLAAILYTSGSTGKPKGVVLSHQNIMAGMCKISEYLKITPGDRLLSILSFGFDYGLNQLTTAFGQCAQIVLADYLFPRDIIKAVERYEITGLASVAHTWIQLLQVPWEGTAMSSLRYITNSGGAIPAHLVLELKRRLPHTEIFLMYGLTEAFRSTYLPPELVEKHPSSIGRAVPGEEIMVLGPGDRPVQPGGTGELVHRGVLVSQGYWNDPGLTAVRFRPNPLQPPEVPLREMVVYSGDQVRIDEEGLLYFIGRWDEMIKCAGNRISPTEVEEVIYQCSGVADAVALGVPHETYGQSVLAVVSLTGQAALTETDILEYCRDGMPSYMVPSEVEIWDSLPRNSNGKLDRAAIRKAVLDRKELQVANE